MTAYIATINVPGYLPMDDDPPTFDTAQDAWTYLADERKRDDEAWVLDDPDDPQGPSHLDQGCLDLEARARRALQTPALSLGTVYANTPGSDSDHDLGLAYTVDYASQD